MKSRHKNIYSKDSFIKLIKRECVLAHRHNQFFSVIEFSLNSNSHKIRIGYLIKALMRRIRETDFIGWTDSNSIGLLLHRVALSHTQEIAKEICDSLRYDIEYQIYCYPINSLEEINQSEKQNNLNRLTFSD